MARALIGGLVRRGTASDRIAVGEPFEATRSALERDFGVSTFADNTAAISGASVVVVAVKPQDARAVLTPLRARLAAERPTVLSVAAGIRTASLARWCGSAPVVRAMPNRPALIGAGATGLFAPATTPQPSRTAAEEIMSAVGTVVWLPDEDALDVVTALSGSGPAYFFLLGELMARAAVELGLDADAAQRLAVATLHGAGLMAGTGDGDLVRLRAEVTSKGGTTEAAVRTLEAADFRGLVARALGAAAQRSRELAAQFGEEAPGTPSPSPGNEERR